MNDRSHWQQALAALLEGNARYRDARLAHPHASPEWRAQLAAGQHPSAAVLGCADSRLPPELIFDQGLGDLFVVRVAGNVLDDIVIGSLEYAAANLDIPLILVMGHSSCGAVGAAVAVATSDAQLEGCLPFLADALQPAVAEAMSAGENRVDTAARINAIRMADQLARCEPLIAPRVREGTLKVLPAFYHLDTGAVELLATPG